MYNNELQIINTQEKAYLLGLLYADGSVNKDRGLVTMYLNNKDEKLLRQIVELFPFFVFTNADKKNQKGIFASNRFLKDDMILHGCFPQKSTDNSDLIEVPEIETSLLRHFIRGYFDGDGGCTITESGGKTQKRVYIYSASKNLIKDMVVLLFSEGMETSISITHLLKITIKTKDYQKFYDYLYKDATIWMERKKLKFDKILKTNIFIQKEAPNCIHCSSHNTVFNGHDYYKGKRRRVWCKDCDKNFIIRTALISSNTNNAEDELLEG